MERAELPGKLAVITRLNALARAMIALVAGALTVLAFSPFSLYPLAVLGPALLLLLWLNATPGGAFLDGWMFGLGLLGVGVFWMHISINQFGNLGVFTAVLITLGFVAIMALYYGCAGWVLARIRQRDMPVMGLLSAFCALWFFAEWFRGWLLGGFPWLLLGYSQVDSALGGWAPLLGVYGVSLMVAVSAAALILVIIAQHWRQRSAALAILILIFGGGNAIGSRSWVTSAGPAMDVAIVQGNIPQHQKWRSEMLVPTLTLYSSLTRKHWGADLVVWPETAVPAFIDQVDDEFLLPLQREAQRQGAVLFTGIADRSPDGRYYNAMLALGEGREIYHKRHLVPFGEFMPLKPLIGPLLAWMQVPMSDFSAGTSERPLVTLAGYPAAVSICYEDAFGEEVIQGLPEAAFLVNASNDAWFGDSLAPPQHLQIARMRALETGRYMLRATNTGVSAIIGPRGQLESLAPAFKRQVLSGSIKPLQGVTPYVGWGNWAVVILALMLLAIPWSLVLWRKR